MSKLKILRRRNYSGICEWAQCNHKGSYKEEGSGRVGVKEVEIAVT